MCVAEFFLKNVQTRYVNIHRNFWFHFVCHLNMQLSVLLTGSAMGRTARQRHKKKKNILNKMHTTNLGHDYTIINLISWLKILKWKPFSCLYPTEFPGTGRGLMARENISENNILVQIPLDALITTKTVDDSNLSQILECKALLSQEILAAFLIWEKNKSAASKWAPYINSLPGDYSTPLYLPLATLEHLPDFIKQPIIETQETAHRSFCRLHKLLPSLQECEFRWAWSCVNTRAVYLPKPLQRKDTLKIHILDRDCLALAPFLDLFNHSSSVSVEVRVTSEGYELLTHTPYKKYDQVFISYGPHANLKLFTEYGFALPGNPHDSLPLSEEDLMCAAGIGELVRDGIVEAKIEFLKSQGMIKSAALNRDGATWSALGAVRLLKSTEANPDRWTDVLYSDAAEQSDQATLNGFAIIAQDVKDRLDNCCRQLDHYSANESNSAVNALRFLLSELMEVAHAAYGILQNRTT